VVDEDEELGDRARGGWPGVDREEGLGRAGEMVVGIDEPRNDRAPAEIDLIGGGCAGLGSGDLGADRRVIAHRHDAAVGFFGGQNGFFAACRLTVDKVGTFTTPDVAPSCNVSVLVQCGVNLKSWQGSLFGFPNPLIGIAGWVAPFFVGVAILSGVRFARWFWIAFDVGITGALVFVIWLISQSVFVLGTLCPWCMVTWAVVIPTFWLVTLYNLKVGNIPVAPRARRLFEAAYGYVPLITLLSYIVVAIVAQVRLDVLNHL